MSKKAPIWTKKVVMDLEDAKAVNVFYKVFFIKRDPAMKAAIAQIKAGSPITLDLQNIIVRCLLADIAKQTHVVFIGLNKLCKSKLAKECAEQLVSANRRKV